VRAAPASCDSARSGPQCASGAIGAGPPPEARRRVDKGSRLAGTMPTHGTGRSRGGAGPVFESPRSHPGTAALGPLRPRRSRRGRGACGPV